MHHHHSHVLQLDIQGTPQAWISLEQAAVHMATGSVAWFDGDGPLATLRGGFNVARGRQSVIEVHPIIALRGASKVNLFDVVPAFGRAKLFRRDRFTCAYCGQRFAERALSCEHIVPQARGGGWGWMNLVTACGPCNSRKADRTPEEARMPLLYLPYVPSRFEDFLLEGRHIRADVHEWLAARLPKGSRLS
jgi:5-methylcytosine-specific restriction endonuclease McrA